MNIVKKPYEILIRWNDSGELAGAHVLWRYADSDGEIPPSISDAKPLTMESDPSFTAVLSDVTCEALSRVNAMAQELADAQSLICRQSHIIDELKETLAQMTSAPGSGAVA